MRLLIEGQPQNITLKEVEYATNFFCRKLISAQLLRHLTVIITFKKLRGLKGLAEAIDCDIKPREFHIQIRQTMSRQNILKTLAHELVHVKQYARKELGVVLIGSRLRWHDQMIDSAATNYWEYPWEIEAYGREVGLYEMYHHHLAQNNS